MIAIHYQGPAIINYTYSKLQHPESRHQQRQGLKQAEEALAYKPTSAGEYRQPTSHKLVPMDFLSVLFWKFKTKKYDLW